MTKYVVERLSHLGVGVIPLNGTDVYAPFTLPDERIAGDIVDNAIPKPRILGPSTDRIKPMCRHFKTCGGCATQHATDGFLETWKTDQVKLVLSLNGLTPDFLPTLTSAPMTRRRATFSVKRTKKDMMLGYHARASDILIEISECPLLDPAIPAAFEGIRALVRLGASRKGEVKAAVTVSETGLDIDVHGAKPLEPMQILEASQIMKAHGFARLAWNGEVAVQRTAPVQRMGSAQVVPPSGAFLQATPEGQAAMVSAVQNVVQDAATIVDLFAGCGTFALPLSETAEVHAVEGEADMLDALDAAWRNTQGLKSVTTETRDLFRNPILPVDLKRFEAAVIDPPRAGAKAQAEQLAKSDLQRIAFVSCNPATFARDALILTTAGYRFDWIQVIDQFRWSPHIEVAAQFTRG